MSIISASTTTTTALQYTADTTGTLVFKTGVTPTTALTLNADQSATFAGTVNFATAAFTNLSYTGTLTGGTGVVNLGSGQFYKDASGNVGIGTSSPSAKLDVAGNAVLLGTSGYKYLYFNGAIESSSLRFAKIGKNYDSTYDLGIWASTHTAGNSAATVFYRDLTTESMRINSSGNLLVGTTSSLGGGAAFNLKQNADGWAAAFQVAVDGNYGLACINAAGSVVGGVIISASSTTFATSSDYRLKENIAPMQGALDVVQKLKPVTYNWKADGSSGQGFIAHELQAVVPDCVTGEKDAVDEDGKPIYQGIDTSFLVATLVASIQELKAEFDEYKATHP